MTTKIHKSHLALLKLIEREGNNICADCGSPGTRWASWNLGIFLCIRCAGIHRNLGVHISKVKSVDLDSWTTEQLQSMESTGNRKSHTIYEAALPDFFMRPQSNYAVEEFIRAKYQYKRYCVQADTPTPAQSVVVTETKPKEQNTDKNLVSFDICNNNESPRLSDDSLSDPEYVVQQKHLPKSCHKVLSEGDLISFHPASNASDCEDPKNPDHKNNIMSLYNQSNINQSYQSYGHDVSSCHQRSYGSATEPAYHSTTNIPVAGQSNYLRQIQDKLTSLKVNLASKFRPTEVPPHSDCCLGQPGVANGPPLSRGAAQHSGSGHTLSPHLWQ